MAKGFRFTMKCLHNKVTGSSFLLKIKRPGQAYKRIMVDFGGQQDEKEEILNNVMEFDPTEIDKVIVTHNHLDHMFRLPMLYEFGYQGDIYCSKITAESIPISLSDSIRIMFKDMQDYDKPMLYTSKDVNKTVDNLVGVDFNKEVEILPDVKMMLLGNGHLYGAACILLRISCKKYEDINILFTGDYYDTNEIFEVTPFPDFVYHLNNLSLVMESTYGNTLSSEIEKNFDDILLHATLNKHFVVIPTIAQERLELVLLRLKQLQELGKLDVKIPIYIHSELGKEYYYKIYHTKNCVDCMPENCKFLARGDYTSVLADTSKHKILLASSGMADKGSITFYLPKVIEDPNTTIIFTCYQARSTLGYIIKNSKPGDKIRISGHEYTRKCDVKSTSQFSHHIKQNEDINFIKKFDSISNIFINHGETNTKEILKSVLVQAFPDININIMNRKFGFRISSDSSVTTYETHFANANYYYNFIQKQSMKKNPKSLKTTKKRSNKPSSCYYR